jgi:hypothetical protein
MTEQTPELGEGTDIDAADLDVDEPTEPTATSNANEYVEEGETLGGTGGLDAGGSG